MSDDPTQPAPEHFGRYRLMDRIGRGGMAEVFRAYVEGFEGFRDPFVIKRIRPEKSDSAEFVEMFCNEARICALLHHANIVEVYDFGQIGGAYFMAMEHLRGRDLSAVMRALRLRLEAVPPLVAAHVARQAALGLQHAHEAALPDGRPAEIVHRDVTPSNIMLLRTGGVKVLDFGIAKAAEMARHAVVSKSRVQGKIAYLSPEQVRNADLDGRSDVFSLGVVLWEMLVGQRLFAGENEFQKLRNVLTFPVPPPSSKRVEVPPALDAVVARALARDRDARYPSARALADDLAGVLRDVPAGETEDGVGRLLTELFGDETSGVVSDLMSTSMSGGTFSSPDPVPEAPPPSPDARAADARAPDARAPDAPAAARPAGVVLRRRVLPIVAGIILGAGLAWAAWHRLGAVNRAEPDPSRRADTASAGT